MAPVAEYTAKLLHLAEAENLWNWSRLVFIDTYAIKENRYGIASLEGISYSYTLYTSLRFKRVYISMCLRFYF